MATIKVGISKRRSANQKYSSKIKFQAKRYGITIQGPQNNLPKNKHPSKSTLSLAFHPTSETLSRLRERAILMWGAPGMNPGIPYYLTTNRFSSVRNSLPHWRCVLKSAFPMWCVLCSCTFYQTVAHCTCTVTE